MSFVSKDEQAFHLVEVERHEHAIGDWKRLCIEANDAHDAAVAQRQAALDAAEDASEVADGEPVPPTLPDEPLPPTPPEPFQGRLLEEPEEIETAAGTLRIEAGRWLLTREGMEPFSVSERELQAFYEERSDG